MATARVERRLTAILAADVVGYGRLMGADEEGTLAELKGHRIALVDPKIRRLPLPGRRAGAPSRYIPRRGAANGVCGLEVRRAGQLLQGFRRAMVVAMAGRDGQARQPIDASEPGYRFHGVEIRTQDGWTQPRVREFAFRGLYNGTA